MNRGYVPAILLIGLGATFFGSLAIAAASFPAGYDWRYDVMSSLANPKDNPAAYRIAETGMGISGVFLSLLGLCIRNRLQRFALSPWTNIACGCFVLGGLFLTISALITPGHQAFLGISKAHAKSAQAGAIGFDLGMALTLPAVLSLPASMKHVRVAALILVLVPVTLYLLSRILLTGLGAPHLVTPTAHPLLWGSLAFWEWVGSLTVYLYLLLIVVALRPAHRLNHKTEPSL